jgi:LysM repeat protein
MLYPSAHSSVSISEAVVLRIRNAGQLRRPLSLMLLAASFSMAGCSDPDASYVGTQAIDRTQQSGLGVSDRDRPIILEPAPADASITGTRYQWNGNPQRVIEGKGAAAGPAKAPSLKPQPAPQSAVETPSDSQLVEVQPGDTLHGIAERYGVTVASLSQANALTGAPLQVGQKLVLPPAAR